MKTIAILIALVITPMVSSAQTFFDKLEDMDGVDVVVVSKDMFELLSKFENIGGDDNEAVKVFKMIQELNEFKLFSTKDKGIADKMNTMADAAIKAKNLTELMRIKQEDSRVKIYVKSTKNKDYVSEVLMFVKGVSKQTDKNSESMIVSLTGNIDINKMSELADTFSKKAKK